MSTEHKIWIGNLDQRLTEYQIIQVLKKCGNLTHFEFLFHTAGPQKGFPRGYCFAEFECKEEAQRAIQSLNGKEFASKKWQVGWARDNSDTAKQANKSEGVSKKSDTSSKKTNNLSRDKQMAAIEAKLRALDRASSPAELSSVSKHPVLARQENRKAAPQSLKHVRRKPYRR